MRIAVTGFPLLSERQWNLCSEFEDCGVDTHLIVPDYWPEIPSEDHPTPDQQFDIHYHPVVFPGHEGGYLLRGVTSTLQKIDPNVVVTHAEPWHALTLSVGLVCARLSIPHLVFSWENLERVPHSTVQRGMEYAGYRFINGTIAGSGAARRRLRSRGYSGPIIESPQTGVDTESFTPDSGDESILQEFGVPSDADIVLYAGRFAPEKGLKSVITSATDVLDTHENAHFLFVGGGEFADEMERAVLNRGINERVTMVTERQPYSRMTAIFALASVFLYPSRTTETWAEQFGYAAAEAMSAGVPVVTTRCGALPDVVGDTGIVCPEDDPDALARAVNDLLSDAERRRELGDHARERAVNQFSIESVANDHLSFAQQFI